MAGVPYRDILDLFDAQKATNGYQSLPEFAASLNELTGTQAYDAGLHPSWVKNASVGLDRAIESTGAPDMLGDAFAQIGGAVGYEDAGRAAGKALPRGLVNFLPMLAAAPFTGGGSVAAGLLGTGATAASMGLIGADTYTQTGSPAAGLISAGALPVAGMAAKLGGQLALKAIGAPLLEGAVTPLAYRGMSGAMSTIAAPEGLAELVGQHIAETGTQKVASYLGGQAAALGTFEVAGELQSVIQGDGLYNPVSPERLFSTLIGQLPFAALDIPRVMAKTPSVDSMRRFLTTEAKNVDAQKAQDNWQSAPVRTETDKVDPLKLVRSMEEKLKSRSVVEQDTTLTPEQRDAKLAELLGETDKTAEATQGTPEAGKGFGQWLNSLSFDSQGQKLSEVQGSLSEVKSSVITPETLQTKSTQLQAKADEIKAKATEIVDVLPPTNIAEVLSQIEQVAKAANKSGLVPVTIEALKTNFQQVEEVAASVDNATQMAIQVERNKIGRGRNTEAATLARNALREKEYVEKLTDFYNREIEAKAGTPRGKLYAEDVAAFHDFVLEHQEKLGEGRENGSLTREMINAYFNWERAGRPDGIAKLKGMWGQRLSWLMRQGTKSRPVVKEDGTTSNDASKNNKKFTFEEAVAYAKANELDHHEPALRTNDAKTKSWYVLEDTRKAVTHTSLETELGGQKSEVNKAVSDNPDMFAQSESRQDSPINFDEAGPLITTLNDEVTGPIKVQAMDDLISSVRLLDDDVITTYGLRHLEDVDAATPQDIQAIRDRLGAILSLQKQFGNKAVNDKSSMSVINRQLNLTSRFRSFEEMQAFNRDQGTQTLLLEATREMIRTGKALPAVSYEYIPQSQKAKDALRLDGSYRGLDNLEPHQAALADGYKLTSDNARAPLEIVAQTDKGLLGIVANSLLKSFGERIAKVGLVNLRVENGEVFSNAEYNPATGKVLFGRDLLPQGEIRPMDIEYLHSVIVHETLHALTHDLLRMPENSVEKANLDSIRQQAINALPREIRAIFGKSQAEGRYDQYVADRSIRMYDLTPEQAKWHNVLYGLENVDEFISQSFGSSQMQTFLRGEYGTRRNIFQTFKDFVKKLFNLGHLGDSMFDDVIGATDRLLNPKLRKPLERDNVLSGFMGNLGLMPKQVGERTQTVGQVLDLMRKMLPTKKNQAAYRSTLAETIAENFAAAHAEGKLSLEDIATLNRAQTFYDNLTQGDREMFGSLFMIEGQPAPETLADMLTVVTQSLAEPTLRKDFIDGLFYVDKPLRDAFSALRRYTTTITSGTQRVIEAAQKGLVNEIVDSPGIVHISELYKGTQELLKHEKFLQRQEDKLAGLQTVTPIGFRAAQVEASTTSTLRPAPRNENIRTIAEEMGIVQPSLLSRTFEPLAQLAEKYPVMRDALYKVFKHQGDVREATRLALLPFAGEFGPNGEVTLSRKRLQQAYEVAQSPVMNKAVSDIRRLMNERKVNFDPTTLEFRTILDSLGAESRPRVVDFVNQMTKSMKVMQDTIVARQTELGTITLAQLIQARMPEFRANQSQSMARTLLETLRVMSDDPTQVPTAQQTLQGIQARLTPEVFQEITQFAVGDRQRLGELKQFYANRPWFATEQRFRRFLLRMTNAQGETYTADYLNERQATIARRRLEGQGYTLADLIDRKGNDNHPSFTSDAMIDKVEEINRTRMAQISQVLRDQPQVLESISRYLNIENDLTRSQTASQLVNRGSNLRREAGREELDMVANHVTYINRVINSQTTKVTRAGLELSLMDPQMRGQPELSRLAQSGAENYLRPDTEAGRALSRANFLYYMGMNISTGFMELGQSAFSLIPTMVREGAKVSHAYESVIRTAKTIAQWGVSGKWTNPEHEQVINRASSRGDIGLGALGEAMDDNAHASIGLSQMATVQEMGKLQSLVQKPLALYEKIATGIYSKFTAFNARMSLLVAFDHFRAQGQGFEEAFANAERINNVAMFAGGRAARPIGLYSAEGNAGRTAAMAVGSLQSYTLGMISMMGRYFMQGFGSAGRDLTPTARTNAKKAALIMFGTQLAAAGALGLPGVGAGIALLEQMFPNLELNKAIRENLAKLGGDDQALGSFISDTALRGIPNQIGGVDVGSRLSLGNNVMGLSSYDGFDPINILGPSFNLFKNMAVGVTQASQGQLGAAAQTILPPAFKKIIQLGQGEGAIRDQSGKLLMEPSMGEKFAMYVGFQPKRLSDVKDAKRIESRSQEIERRETIQFNSKLADYLQANDQAGLKGALQAKLSEDNTFDPRAAIRQAASLVEQRTMPLDLTRTSTSQSAGSLLETYQAAKQTPSELQRLQLRKSIEASTGIPGIGRVTPHDIQVAQAVDQLMAKGLTRDAAKAQVEKMFASSTSVLPF